jgi:hypothetical protein
MKVVRHPRLTRWLAGCRPVSGTGWATVIEETPTVGEALPSGPPGSVLEWPAVAPAPWR